VSHQPSPTDKSKDHVEAVYRNTQRQVDPEVYRDVDQDSTEVTYGEGIRMKSTGWSPKQTSTDDYRIKMNERVYKSMPSTDDYRLQDILYRACGGTAQSSYCASALQHGKYNHLRET
jgi:hypothetical protein